MTNFSKGDLAYPTIINILIYKSQIHELRIRDALADVERLALKMMTFYPLQLG